MDYTTLCIHYKRSVSCISLIMGLALGVCTLHFIMEMFAPYFVLYFISNYLNNSSMLITSPIKGIFPSCTVSSTLHLTNIPSFGFYSTIYHFRKLVYAWIVKALVQVMYYTSSVTSEYSIIPLNVNFTAIKYFGGLKANRRKNTQNASSILISHIQYGWLFTLAGNIITFGFIFSHFNHLVSSHLVSYLTPLNINYYWNIGFLISFFFIGQLSSGIILSTSYTSDVTFAYYSISSC